MLLALTLLIHAHVDGDPVQGAAFSGDRGPAAALGRGARAIDAGEGRDRLLAGLRIDPINGVELTSGRLSMTGRQVFIKVSRLIRF